MTYYYMGPEILKAAAAYADLDLGRAVQVTAILDHGDEAMALCQAKDGGDSFSLLLRYGRPGFFETGDQAWFVIEESNVEDFSRNAHRDNAFEAARQAAILLEGGR